MVSALTLLVTNRTVRAFGYGFASVLLGIYLKLLGGTDPQVVASLGVSLVAGAGLNVLVGYYGDRFGRRNAMAAFGLLMAGAGAILAAAPSFPVALLALVLGATSPTGTEVSPFLSVEQSIVAEDIQSTQHSRGLRGRPLDRRSSAPHGYDTDLPGPAAAHVPPVRRPRPRRNGD